MAIKGGNMETRRGILKAFLLEHVSHERTTHILTTIEPLFVAVESESITINEAPLKNRMLLITTSTNILRENLTFVLMQSLMKNLLALMRKTPPLTNDQLGTQLFHLIFDWILAECCPIQDNHAKALEHLVQQTLSSPHT
ncbi:hypothetical protein A2318_00800 [Candidatus Uhrbacteria bacterium RIFOXYB2_FULL_45_11]|uniref:Uncharacterized protein n=1 Tax=Candidatus Uhrbacteria bacterium RIFOXYB2_FULL_45_11 TaxID=1802421 RepID=A0A1F7W440_9BACT|nr:MAG: hypothetical protein A2318_00800 [Candidatus Uhrbacteria bacterium RIFOXYB2_FULL_45_11]